MLLAQKNYSPPLAMPLQPEYTGEDICIDDRKFRVRINCSNPNLMRIDDFLTPHECSSIIDLAKNRIADSAVIEDGSIFIDQLVRSSRDTCLHAHESILIKQIETRAKNLVHWPLEKMETMSVIRYGPGDKFSPHWDYFDETIQAEESPLHEGGQRVGTLILYLSEAMQGGATNFPFAGLNIRPKLGSALYFTYQMHDQSMDISSLHGGAPVLAGEKWIATFWLREKSVRNINPTPNTNNQNEKIKPKKQS